MHGVPSQRRILARNLLSWGIPMKTTTELYLSRNYVEFGPLTPEEITGFAARGMLLDGDYLRDGSTGEWQPCAAWLAAQQAPAKAAKAPAKKKAAPKKTAA